MKPEASKSHPQFQRIEARYRGASSPGWYLADLGNLSAIVHVPVWVYSTWAPFEVNLIGSSSDDFILLVDNTYVSGFAFNLAKIALAAQLFPDADDYADLTRGNLKKFIAEQQYLVARNGQSMRWIIEYLIEYAGRNRRLDQRFKETPEGREFLKLVSLVAANCPLFHEVGHVAYGLADYKTRIRNTIDKHITATLGGPGHGIKRLEVEVFCDLFSAVNSIGLARGDGWDSNGLRNLYLFVLMASFLCIKTRELVLALETPGKKVSLAPQNDILMARFAVVASAIDEALAEERHAPGSRALPFPDVAYDLSSQWLEATGMAVRDPETTIIATILANPFASPELGGFDHVMASLNQMSPLSDLSTVLGGSDIHPLNR